MENFKMQNRKLLIFGNGLGMSIDPNHFSLVNALRHVWDNTCYWNHDLKDRRLIQRCIPFHQCPQSEDDMDRLHLAAVSCNFLKEIPRLDQDVDWLSHNGHTFPEVTQKYIHIVATYLCNNSFSLPIKFETKLLEFIKRTNSHVATLNYDKLLYESFIRNDITTDGYQGHLVDGIWRRGFNENNLERYRGNDFGYYLHLHGSPLFYENDDIIYKHRHNNLDINSCYPSKHIVLTHIKHKLSVISSSRILSTYWRYLHLALAEVDEVILFGYSGLDDHLNKLLRMHHSCKKFTVVEWNGSGTINVRNDFWEKELGKQPHIIQLPNITGFEDWD